MTSSSLQLHRLQYVRFPCPSPSPRACSNACPLSRWCHPTILSSVAPFSSCPWSFTASGSSPMSLKDTCVLTHPPLLDRTESDIISNTGPCSNRNSYNHWILFCFVRKKESSAKDATGCFSSSQKQLRAETFSAMEKRGVWKDIINQTCRGSEHLLCN